MKREGEVRIFLASPGDTARERAFTYDVAAELDRTVGRRTGVSIRVTGWEKDGRPGWGADGQSILNETFGDMSEYDLFVGILAHRYGQPTPRAGSGTEEEFERAVQAFETTGRPNIWLYFNQEPFAPRTVDDTVQKGKVLAFREKAHGGGLTRDYTGPEDFRQKLHEDLLDWMTSHSLETPGPPPTPSTSSRSRADSERRPSHADLTVCDTGNWVLVKSLFVEAEHVHLGEDRVTIRLVPESTEVEAALQDLQGLGRRGEPVTFAYRNRGFLANVKSVEVETVDQKPVWSVTLQPHEVRTPGMMAESAYNSISAVELTTMRARLLLLNETPSSGGDDVDDKFLMTFVSGGTHGAPIPVEAGIFPDFWRAFAGEAEEQVLTFARLWAIFRLMAGMVCETILELTLGPVREGSLHVQFRGRRHRCYSNVDPAVIEVEGDCPLMP